MNAVPNPQHLDAVRRARAAINSVGSLLQGAPVGATLRDRIPRLLWQHAVEDGDSIVCLVERCNLGSARALLRPQLESLARAAWAKVHASDEQLAAFANGTGEPPGISRIMQLLMTPDGNWTVRGIHIPFENIWEGRGSAFHDTAHRGTRAIARTAIANQSGTGHVAEDEISVLYIACSCAGIAAAALLEDVGRDADADTTWAETADFMDYVHHQQ